MSHWFLVWIQKSTESKKIFLFEYDVSLMFVLRSNLKAMCGMLLQILLLQYEQNFADLIPPQTIAQKMQNLDDITIIQTLSGGASSKCLNTMKCLFTV